MRVGDRKKRDLAVLARFLCEYCKSPEAYATHRFSVDHIVPCSKGGSSGIENLAYACQGCNSFKYNKIEGLDPLTGKMFPLFNPRTQEWKSHFAWNEDYTRMIGRTRYGVVTILALRLNRPNLINLRKLLVGTGKHPQ